MAVGWRIADTLRIELALNALEMAIWSRGNREGPWDRVTDVTTATMEWVARYNNERPHFTCGNIPLKEFGEELLRAASRAGELKGIRQARAAKISGAAPFLRTSLSTVIRSPRALAK